MSNKAPFNNNTSPKKTINKSNNSKQTHKRKRSALIICQDETQFWTTQKQFWQWVRELKIVKLQDNPLTGKFNQPYEELMILVGHTVLNLAHRNHLTDAISARRRMKRR